MRVLCKNTRSLTDLRIWELVDELKNIQWDILCMSETRGSDQDVSVLGGHRLITTTMEDKYAGVAILVNTRWCKDIIYVGRISGRVMYVDIQIAGHVYRYICGLAKGI